jgi:uncharacterized protein YkwD
MAFRLPVCLALLTLAACGGGRGAGSDSGSGSPSPTPTPSPVGVTTADRQYCVDRVNALRAGIGRRALARTAQLEGFGDTAAKNDGQSGIAHQYYRQTNGAGTSLAENEVLRWSLVDFGTVQGVIRGANDGFWAEGPGGGHYQNIANAQWTQVGCGFYVDGSAVTYTTEFH